jgi:hypothetical protein
MFPPCLWGRRDPRGLHHELQSGGHHVHHLRPHVCHQRSRKTDLGETRWTRGRLPRPPLLPDCLHPLCGPFIAVHVVDDVGVHRAIPVVVAVLGIRAVQRVGMAQTPCPVCGVKALYPLPRQLCLFSEERDKLGHDLWMELAAGTILEEVLVLDGVKEDGVGFTGDDQLFAGAVAGHIELSVAIVLGGLSLRPLLSCQQTRHEAGETGRQPRGCPLVEFAEGHTRAEQSSSPGQ